MKFDLPKIMGILNMTPDSFSGDGLYYTPTQAFQKIETLIEERADIIDIGGESTKPGSTRVSEQEELRRVKPIIDFVYRHCLVTGVVYSIDTYKARVADYALSRGFHIVNDVTGFRGDARMKKLLLRYKPLVVIMYAKDKTPRTTQSAPQYINVIETIKTFLINRSNILIQSGFPKENIIIDPGMGAFVSSNKTYSLEIIGRIQELTQLNFPILVGISRKLGGNNLEEKDHYSALLAKTAIQRGTSIIRTHNVVLTQQILKTL